MQQEMQKETEFSLSEIFSALLAKWKLIVLVVLAGVIFGGVLGYLKSYDVVYYGTDMTFFVSPEKGSASDSDNESEYAIYGQYSQPVMDTMVRFLTSDITAEKIMEGIEGAPAKPEKGSENYEQQAQVYTKYLRAVKGSMAFSYKQDGSMEIDVTDTESRSFIYVSVKVLETQVFDKEFTRNLIERIQIVIPELVETKMYKPDGYEKTGCSLVSLYPVVELLNENYALTETIKFALLLGVAAFAIVCVVILLLDRMDKRLRDTDFIEKKWNVPVLGMIPHIEIEEEQKTQGGNE